MIYTALASDKNKQMVKRIIQDAKKTTVENPRES